MLPNHVRFRYQRIVVPVCIRAYARKIRYTERERERERERESSLVISALSCASTAISTADIGKNNGVCSDLPRYHC